MYADRYSDINEVKNLIAWDKARDEYKYVLENGTNLFKLERIWNDAFCKFVALLRMEGFTEDRKLVIFNAYMLDHYKDLTPPLIVAWERLQEALGPSARSDLEADRIGSEDY